MNKNTIEQSGRSMIEMLGVLAIIGVLSVGGISGYSKAMDRYRINETMNQVTYIMQNTRDLFKTQPNMYGSMSSEERNMSEADYLNRKLADKTKIFPDSIKKNNYKNMFDGEIRFFVRGRFKANDGKAVLLSFLGIPQESCIELATKDWNSSLGIIVMRVFVNDTDSRTVGNSFLGNCTSKYNQGDVLACVADMPLTVEQAAMACSSKKSNRITWKFY